MQISCCDVDFPPGCLCAGVGLFCEFVAEIGNGFVQAFVQRNHRLPPEALGGQRYVRTPQDGVIGGKRQVGEFAAGGGEFFQYDFGQFADGELAGVAEVDRAKEAFVVFHHTYHACYQIVDVLE